MPARSRPECFPKGSKNRGDESSYGIVTERALKQLAHHPELKECLTQLIHLPANVEVE